MHLTEQDEDESDDLHEIDPADVGHTKGNERRDQEKIQRGVIQRADDGSIFVVRHQVGVHSELSQGRGKVEGAVRVVPREELLRRDVRHRDRVDVVALAEDERHRREDKRGERETRRDRVARRWP